MHIVRNCIDIIGITPEGELPKKINGQIIETSETENLIIEDNIKIRNIYQIIIDVSIKKTRIINTPINKIVVLDISKKFKIAYYDMDNNMSILELRSPYNIFFDIENDDIEIEKINIYVADAYFELVNSKTLYDHLLYIIDVNYIGNVRKTGRSIGFNKDSIEDDFHIGNWNDKNEQAVTYELKDDEEFVSHTLKDKNSQIAVNSLESKDEDYVNQVFNDKNENDEKHALNEVLISGDKKIEVSEKEQFKINIKNNLLDMEDEYL